jgi:integrase
VEELADITRILSQAHEKRLTGGPEKKSLSSKYRLNLYALLKSIFEVAVEYDFASKNPVRKRLHRPKCERRSKVALTSGQVYRVVQSVPDERRTLFLCLALTGLRIGEALALKRQDIDSKAGNLAVTHNLWRGRLISPKTNGSAATVPLASTLIEALEDHRQRSDWSEAGDFVFCKLDGSPYDPDHFRNDVLYPALEIAGVERVAGMHGFHLFRHSAASIIEAQTGSLKTTQQFLRHTNISTTGDIYVHVDESNTRAAVEALARSIMTNCGLTVAA